MIALRLRHKVIGGHVHCRLFSAKSKDYTFAKNGDIVFSIEEWPGVRERFMRAGIEVLEDGASEGSRTLVPGSTDQCSNR